jgi:hypothetical protein
MLLGIKERAEGRIRPRGLDVVEQATWIVAFVATIVASRRVLFRRRWTAPLAQLGLAIAALMIVLLLRPPLAIAIAADALLVTWLFTTRRADPPDTEDSVRGS